MSYDNFLQREHTRYFNAGPICRHCGCEEEIHDEITGRCECEDCPGYEARDPRDDENDDPGYYEE